MESLAVWWHNKPKTRTTRGYAERNPLSVFDKNSTLTHRCVSAVIESLAVWRHYKPKTKGELAT